MRSHALFVIGNEPLEISDAQRLHFFRQQALAFAVIFLWADPARNGGKDVVFTDFRCRGQELPSYD